jgi:hypothetical protein
MVDQLKNYLLFPALESIYFFMPIVSFMESIFLPMLSFMPSALDDMELDMSLLLLSKPPLLLFLDLLMGSSSCMPVCRNEMSALTAPSKSEKMGKGDVHEPPTQRGR